MLSSEDLERFYFQYQTEAVPLGMSVQTFMNQTIRTSLTNSDCQSCALVHGIWLSQHRTTEF